jgi:hypothetical protein
MGAKAGTTDVVWDGAYNEALQVLTSVRTKTKKNPPGQTFFAANRFLDTALGQRERETQVCTPEALHEIRSTFLSGAGRAYTDVAGRYVVHSSVRSELAWLEREVARLAEHGGEAYHLYLYRFDSPWLRMCSYSVVRAFVPAFLKLHLRESEATPLSPRLQQFMELHGAVYSEETINTRPHFFP